MKRRLKKFLIPIFLSVICGYVCGYVVYDIYKPKASSLVKGEKLYLIQAGEYSSYDKMASNMSKSNYAYYEDSDGVYKAIIGVTKNKNNIDKIKKTYNSEVVVSEYYSNNLDVNKKIGEYDEKINMTDNDDEVKKYSLEVIALYKDIKDNTLVKIT